MLPDRRSAWLRTVVAFDDHEIRRARGVAKLRGLTILLGIVAGERGRVVSKLDHDVARPSMPSLDDVLPSAHEEARAVLAKAAALALTYGW